MHMYLFIIFNFVLYYVSGFENNIFKIDVMCLWI